MIYAVIPTLFLAAATLQPPVSPPETEPGPPRGASSPITIDIAAVPRLAEILEKLAQRYNASHGHVAVKISHIGPLTAMRRLSQGETTLVALDRTPSDEEVQRVRRLRNEEPVGVPIAMDAVVIVVPRGNSISSLTLDQVAQVFTHRIADWPPLGGTGSDIHRHMPSADFGCADILRFRALKGQGYSQAITSHADVSALLTAVQRDGLALGACPMTDFVGVKVVPIRRDAESPAVLPTVETVQRREYPLAHYLYLYVPGRPEGPVTDWISFVLSKEGQEIIAASATGVVPLPFRDAGR